MNLNELRDRAYKTACDHGFHDEELSNEHCLCLVISELMEAVEADRKGKQPNIMQFERGISYPMNDFKQVYDYCIKGTVAEELADAAIRLLDLAGYRGIAIETFTEEMIYESTESCNDESFTESIYAIATIPVRFKYEYDYSFDKQLNSMLLNIIGLSNYMGIDLLWHIEQKMRYNELRSFKHGNKKY
jgi:NTP pyrophosphatase (non-canonical NTP hydrolase)|nr:MAG TPA: NTP-PPase-like protein [Caudoviricetes sp.]